MDTQINDIDAIKAVIEQHGCTASDGFVVSDDVYSRIRSGVVSSLEPHDELLPDAKISIDNVLIIPFSSFVKSYNFEQDFTNESLIFIKNLNK